MRVPCCAIVAALTAWAGCGGSFAEPHGSQPSAASCERVEPPKDLDPASMTWELLAPSMAKSSVLDGVFDGCDSFVLLAHPAGPGGGKTIPMGPSSVARSVDGTTWTSGSIDIDRALFPDLAHGNGKWVAVGRLGLGEAGVIAVADRPDTETWRKVFSLDSAGFDRIAFGAGTFVATSRFNIAFSRDAEHWSFASIPQQTPPVQLFDVAFGNGRFVVAGVGGAFSSSDGRTWERVSGPPGELLAMQDIHFVGSKFYSFGASGGLESSDGKTFRRVAVTTPVAAIGGALIGIEPDAELTWVNALRPSELTNVFISNDDGDTWSQQPLNHVDTADCTVDVCAVIPSGILVMRPN
jgi:hypothetical protein